MLQVQLKGSQSSLLHIPKLSVKATYRGSTMASVSLKGTASMHNNEPVDVTFVGSFFPNVLIVILHIVFFFF